MKNSSLPKLEPLINSIKDFYIGEYLKSREFKRYLIQAGIDEFWRDEYENVKRNRTYVSFGMDHEKFDSIDTFTNVCNILYTENFENFFFFINDFLFTFQSWKKESLDLENVIEDLELLSAPKEILSKLNSQLNNYNSKPVENSTIEKHILNSKKLEKSILKMEESIKKKEYNLTLTYAYSCLEGIFKAYIYNNIDKNNKEIDLSKLSKKVKTHLIENFRENEIDYPEQILNLLGTITNAISNARNSFSESHFDNSSDEWLAEFAKDCVNSIGRLILKFIK